MEAKLLPPILLNLAGPLPGKLDDYFAQRGIKVAAPGDENGEQEWTHVLTKDMQTFAALSESYQTVKKDIKIISLSHVEDLRDFISANGKLIFDEVWLEGPLGSFVLDKFFQEYAGIALGDNYPSFQEKGAFSVVNPFNTGDYLDRMVHQAFAHGANALSVKTFFDHVLMYLAGLKKKGKVGVPIEVTYGAYEETFALQMHFFAQGLLMEDVTSCLSSAPTRAAEERLLNISVESADFFDFTFLSQVNKVVVTALWTKNEKLKAENRGLMFANLSSAASITGYPTAGETIGLIQTGEIEDMTELVQLPGTDESEETIKISGEKFSESLAQKISSSVEIEKVKQIISGDISEDELVQVLASGEGEEDDKITVASTDEVDEIVNLVKGTIEEEKQVFKVEGQKFRPDDFVVRIAAGIQDKAEDSEWKVRSLGQKLPETIKTGLFDFAKKLKKPVEDLSTEDLDQFQNQEIPEIVRSRTTVVNRKALGVLKDLRTRLESGLKSEFMEDSMDKIFESVKTPEDVMRVRALLKETLKNSLDNNFKLSDKDTISKEEQDLLVKSLTVSLAEEEEKIRVIVTNEKAASETDSKPLFISESSKAEKELQHKLDSATDENKMLKSKVRTLMAEVKSLQNAKAKMAEIHARAEAEAEAMTAELADNDEKLRKEIQLKAQQGILTSSEQTKLSQLLERESKLIADARLEEMKARKLQIEANKKDAMFGQELEKYQRMLKAKDLMLAKAKESMQALMEKKDKAIFDLQNKVEQMTMALAAGPSQTQAATIRDLEKQNQGLNKMLEMYKAKIQSLANNMQTKGDDASAKEELRKLQMMNQQFKNQVDAAKKELAKFQDKASHDHTAIMNLRKEKNLLEQQLKKNALEAAPKEAKPASNETEHDLKRAQAQIQVVETQLRESQAKLKETEGKLVEALKSQKQAGSGDESLKSKITHLEANVNKLSKDLVDAKNQLAEMKKETNKLRQEKTAQQNQLDKLKKEADKAKTAAPKKPGAGGKAA